MEQNDLTKEQILAALGEILSAIKPDASLDRMSMDTNLLEDIGVDSLTKLLMSLAIENKFHIKIDPAAHFYKVSDVVEYIYESV